MVASQLKNLDSGRHRNRHCGENEVPIGATALMSSLVNMWWAQTLMLMNPIATVANTIDEQPKIALP